MADRARWLGSLVLIGVAVVACEDPAPPAPPGVVPAERGISMPAGGIAAIGLKLEGFADGPCAVSFDPLSASGALRGKLRRVSRDRAVLEVSAARTLPPGVYDALVVATGRGVRATSPIQIHVVRPPLGGGERHRLLVDDLGYDAIARVRLR